MNKTDKINIENIKVELKEKLKGKMIVLEGGEGTGKSTLIKKINEYLSSNNEDDEFLIVETREPGGTEVAEKIRNVIVNNQIDPISEAYLFAVARREHLINKVIPAINNKHTVICDRYIFSSYVYQGITKGLGFNYVKSVNEEVLGDLGGIYPDVVIWLDIEPKIGLKRIHDNNRDINKFDGEDLEFHNKVRNGYKYCSEICEDIFIKIDASKSEEEVFIETIEKLYKFFKYVEIN